MKDTVEDDRRAHRGRRDGRGGGSRRPRAAGGGAEEGAPRRPPSREPATRGREVESIEELLVKKEAQAEEDEADEEEDVSSASPARSGSSPSTPRSSPSGQRVRMQKCFLVKHKSQLKDKKRMLCRDCA